MTDPNDQEREALRDLLAATKALSAGCSPCQSLGVETPPRVGSMSDLDGQERDPLKPTISLLCKLGSAVRHLDEYLTPGGHNLDLNSAQSAIDDPEVRAWMIEMDKLAMLPVKR
jgi:hypothetical protein